ncbi:amino acid adenylation domain-containing protein [Oscillatoria sp. HE19RPO]|uniref:amino acid adenylation domain-containing protein n=1 Tax=Oscillatoria sp. HE19RPO TaxID=2954806 RepID=UPI0020C4E8B7|nr:amino acid adenylation domain-containing protein [Oscillatoria sp. HE19RPO]
MSDEIIKYENSDINPKDKFYDPQPLTEAERHKILHEWNNTTTEYPHDRCIHQLFEEQVERTPDAVAVVFEEEQLTYQQLNAKANQLAHYLQGLGVGPEVLVGMCVERSIRMIVGLLGILKAGGAYIPLDPAYPLERLAFMLEDSSAPVLLTQSKLVETLAPHSARVVCLDADWKEISKESELSPLTGVRPENLAYVIYTSGSTGKPKGVLISHSSLLNLVFWHQHAFEVKSSDRATQLAGTAFDASVWEIWPYLASGASLYLIEPAILLSPEKLRDWLLTKEITITFVPTPIAEKLLFLQWPSDVALRILLTGGDQLHHYPSTSIPFKVVNNYGPTENTVVTTSGLVVCDGTDNRFPHIGRAIFNTKIYILDHHLQLVSIGVPGELHIAGAGLARGYLNRPDLTEQKFIPNPFSDESSSRLYKTGDLARYLPDGNIEFLGRIDNQVKIRGFRIELGEIEAVLSQHPAIVETVVVVQQDVSEHQYLAAYIVSQNSKPISRSDLRAFLKEKLPDYMVPGVFVMLDALPLTPNGKVDRRALHEYPKRMELDQSEVELSNINITAGTNKQEMTELKPPHPDSIGPRLLSLVANLLRIEVDEIDVSATFLDLGIDSLLILEAMRSIQNTFGVQVEAQQFFEELETIDALTTYIEQTFRLEEEPKRYQKIDSTKTIAGLMANVKPVKPSQNLAQPLQVPLAVPTNKSMNRPNENVEPQTSVEKIISQQLQLMSQQLEILRREPGSTDRSHQEKTTFSEFASPKSFEQINTVSNECPVCSYNEWDPLEEVIVGIVDGAMIPSWHTIHRATVLPGQEKQMESLSKRTEKQPLPYPEWLVQAASKCVEEFAHILQSEGVIVRRPDVVDYSASFRTPDWEVMNGFCSANPRDVFLVIGNEIIEAPMADRSRYFESWAYRSLLKEYLKGGAKWVAAPKPQLLDAQYDPDYKTPANGEEMRYVITEFEPTFDAADFVRFGRDIFVQKSHVTNSLGIEWVRRHLGDEYRVHEVQSLCPQALHIDTTLVPLAPGKVLVNPLFIDVDNLPDYFKSWDILLAPKPNRTPMTLYDTKVISQWVNMNVLSLDEERVVVEKSQESMIAALKDWGFKPIPCEFESYYPFMGSFHCATLDVRRRGVLRSYEMEEGAL